MPSRQETFNTVVKHLRSMDGQSVGLAGVCRYRGSHDRKCAAGILIPDDRYIWTMEGRSAYQGPVVQVLRDLGHDIGLVYDLQLCHDRSWGRGYLETAIQKVADKYGLTIPPNEVCDD